MASLLSRLLNTVKNDVVNPIGRGLQNDASFIGNKFGLPIPRAQQPFTPVPNNPDKYYTQPSRFVPNPLTPISQYAQLWRPGQPAPQIPNLPQQPRMWPQPPGLQVIGGAYGNLQPFGGGSEDSYQPSQALQDTGFTNQTSLNNQLTQGPLANFYRLVGR